MWKKPLSLVSSGPSIERTITIDALVGNLHTYLGAPTGTQAVSVIVDGADAGDIQITTDWAAGSTFTITAINGGRILGLGGRGASGGIEWGTGGDAGSHGIAAQAAISSNGFAVDVDVDDGYLLGGGGGGGGGSAEDLGVFAYAGGGGGGGAGFSVTNGGAAGAQTGVYTAPTPGGTGGPTGPGGGGVAGGGGKGFGGNGGVWGSGGQGGGSDEMFQGTGFYLYGGRGGDAGAAFGTTNGAVVTLTGAKSEATLRTEDRLKGTIDTIVSSMGNFQFNTDSDAASTTHGYTFASTGSLLNIDSSGSVAVSGKWTSATIAANVGDDFEIRIRNINTDDTDGTWDANPGPDGTWFALSSNQTWTFTNGAGARTTASFFEIRHVTQTDAEEIHASFFIQATDTGV